MSTIPPISTKRYNHLLFQTVQQKRPQHMAFKSMSINMCAIDGLYKWMRGIIVAMVVWESAL